MLIAALIIITKIWKQPEFIINGLKKLWFINTTYSYWIISNMEWIQVLTYMNTGNTVLSRSQLSKTIYHIILI